MIYERYYGGEQGGRNNFGSEGDCASLPSIVVRSRSHQFVAARLHNNTTHTRRRQLFASTARRYVDTKYTHTIGLQENSSYNTIWFLQDVFEDTMVEAKAKARSFQGHVRV